MKRNMNVQQGLMLSATAIVLGHLLGCGEASGDPGASPQPTVSATGTRVVLKAAGDTEQVLVYRGAGDSTDDTTVWGSLSDRMTVPVDCTERGRTDQGSNEWYRLDVSYDSRVISAANVDTIHGIPLKPCESKDSS